MSNVSHKGHRNTPRQDRSLDTINSNIQFSFRRFLHDAHFHIFGIHFGFLFILGVLENSTTLRLRGRKAISFVQIRLAVGAHSFRYEHGIYNQSFMAARTRSGPWPPSFFRSRLMTTRETQTPADHIAENWINIIVLSTKSHDFFFGIKRSNIPVSA